MVASGLRKVLRAGLLPLLLLLNVPSAAAEQPRLLVLAPSLAELTFAAGAGDRLVGVVEHSDYPAAALDIPRVGDAFRIDYEAVRRLQPDLILSWASGTPRPIAERLVELGFRVVELDPRRLADIATVVERIGVLAGTATAAQEAAAEVLENIASLRAEYAERDEVTVFYQVSANPWFTVTDDHVISEVLGLCGGKNVFGAVPGLAPSVSLEAILRADPEVVIAGAEDDAWQQDWQRWPFVRAVRNGALYSVSPDLVNRATPRLLTGARQLCAAMDAARTLRAEGIEQ